MALIEQAMENGKAANFSRLPKNLVPNHYYLIIRPEIGECTFSGSEIVNVQVCETTKTISLNSLDIAIQSASFVTSDQGELNLSTRFLCRILFFPTLSVFATNWPQIESSNLNEFALESKKFQIGTSHHLMNRKVNKLTQSLVRRPTEHLSVKIELNKENETAVITFANELKVGAGKLKLQFTGHINNLPIGCYRDKYKDAGGEERYELATHFEGTSCRRAFPCWFVTVLFNKIRSFILDFKFLSLIIVVVRGPI